MSNSEIILENNEIITDNNTEIDTIIEILEELSVGENVVETWTFELEDGTSVVKEVNTVC